MVYACDMLSTGFMGAEHCSPKLGDTAAVFAQGAVGLSATIGLTLLGASRIFAVESIPERKELATVATFSIGAAGVAARDGDTIGHMSVGRLLLLVGLVLWYAFYFVDLAWPADRATASRPRPGCC